MDKITYLSGNRHQELFREAKRFIPGGVNSPVRSFKTVGQSPVFIKKGHGAYLYDENGKKYIDYCLSWGALILGHVNPQVTKSLEKVINKGTSFGAVTKGETELAKLITQAFPSIKQVRLVNSGTEAVMTAIRLARAHTGKNKIIKFEGAYHGHVDYLLAKSGSGLATLGMPSSRGVLSDFTKHTVIIDFNKLKELEKIVKRNQKNLAAIIVEPLAANCGLILPEEGFLQGLGTISRKYGLVLIFDEVITGFRLALGGAQEKFAVMPDLTCLGKVLGAGLPMAAFGGRKEIMQLLAPRGDVYQAGTLSGNPLSVAAAIASLKLLKGLNPYDILAENTRRLCQGIKAIAERNHIDMRVNYAGSMFSVFFTDQDVNDYSTAKRQNVNLFRKLFQGLLANGVYLSPSGFETNFLSIAHTQSDIERTLEAMDKVLRNIRRTIK